MNKLKINDFFNLILIENKSTLTLNQIILILILKIVTTKVLIFYYKLKNI